MVWHWIIFFLGAKKRVKVKRLEKKERNIQKAIHYCQKSQIAEVPVNARCMCVRGRRKGRTEQRGRGKGKEQQSKTHVTQEREREKEKEAD